MGLFDYQSFDMLTKFLKKCEVIVRYTKLMRSDADKQLSVEVAMRAKGHLSRESVANMPETLYARASGLRHRVTVALARSREPVQVVKLCYIS